MVSLKPESEVQQLIQIEAAKHGCLLMRNNSGAFKDESGRIIFFGLGNVSKQSGEQMKSSDLIGITTFAYGIKWNVGIFVAIECKREGWIFNPKDKREQAQLNFINLMKSRGAIAGFCASVEDFKKLIGVN